MESKAPITFFESRTASGVMKLVQLPDSFLAITLNDEVMDGCRFRLDQIEKSVIVYRDICAKAKHAQGDPPTR